MSKPKSSTTGECLSDFKSDLKSDFLNCWGVEEDHDAKYPSSSDNWCHQWWTDDVTSDVIIDEYDPTAQPTTQQTASSGWKESASSDWNPKQLSTSCDWVPKQSSCDWNTKPSSSYAKEWSLRNPKEYSSSEWKQSALSAWQGWSSDWMVAWSGDWSSAEIGQPKSSERNTGYMSENSPKIDKRNSSSKAHIKERIESSHPLNEASDIPNESSHPLNEASDIPNESSHPLNEVSGIPKEVSKTPNRFSNADQTQNISDRFRNVPESNLSASSIPNSSSIPVHSPPNPSSKSSKPSNTYENFGFESNIESNLGLNTRKGSNMVKQGTHISGEESIPGSKPFRNVESYVGSSIGKLSSIASDESSFCASNFDENIKGMFSGKLRRKENIPLCGPVRKTNQGTTSDETDLERLQREKAEMAWKEEIARGVQRRLNKHEDKAHYNTVTELAKTIVAKESEFKQSLGKVITFHDHSFMDTSHMVEGEQHSDLAMCLGYEHLKVDGKQPRSVKELDIHDEVILKALNVPDWVIRSSLYRPIVYPMSHTIFCEICSKELDLQDSEHVESESHIRRSQQRTDTYYNHCPVAPLDGAATSVSSTVPSDSLNGGAQKNKKNLFDNVSSPYGVLGSTSGGGYEWIVTWRNDASVRRFCCMCDEEIVEDGVDRGHHGGELKGMAPRHHTLILNYDEVRQRCLENRWYRITNCPTQFVVDLNDHQKELLRLAIYGSRVLWKRALDIYVSFYWDREATRDLRLYLRWKFDYQNLIDCMMGEQVVPDLAFEVEDLLRYEGPWELPPESMPNLLK